MCEIGEVMAIGIEIDIKTDIQIENKAGHGIVLGTEIKIEIEPLTPRCPSGGESALSFVWRMFAAPKFGI